MTLKCALQNTGQLIAKSGATLTVQGAVTGAGVVDIQAGKLSFGSSFTENVSFQGTAAGGVLVLAQSKSYTGTIANFSASGGTSLDLKDIAFKSAGEATFSGTAVGGVLTVTDGIHTAHIKLHGNYLSAAFTASALTGGGTVIIASPKVAASPAAVEVQAASPAAPAIQGLSQAMAGFRPSAIEAAVVASSSAPPRLAESLRLADRA
jgi:hypothetical protein